MDFLHFPFRLPLRSPESCFPPRSLAAPKCSLALLFPIRSGQWQKLARHGGHEERENGILIPPTCLARAPGWTGVQSSTQGHGSSPGPFSTMAGLAGWQQLPYLLLEAQESSTESLLLLDPGCFTLLCESLNPAHNLVNSPFIKRDSITILRVHLFSAKIQATNRNYHW